ncbi:MAG: hypothetical protein ABL996_05500 [Micropepsaceae bacterium]
MNKTIAAGLASCLLAAAAGAHPGGHGEDDVHPTFDCSAIAGTYAIDTQRLATVSVADGKVTIEPAGTEKATGNCVSPLIGEGKNLPRAVITSGAALGAKFGAPGCCIVVLKNDELSFDNGEVWKRKKPAK